MQIGVVLPVNSWMRVAKLPVDFNSRSLLMMEQIIYIKRQRIRWKPSLCANFGNHPSGPLDLHPMALDRGGRVLQLNTRN
jgi:hypothetical protein